MCFYLAIMTQNYDYRAVLKSEFSRRIQRNSSYSLRCFARDLGVTYSRLNESMNQKKGLSSQKASQIGTKLGLSKLEQTLFVLSVQSQHARSRLEKEESKTQLAKKISSNATELNLANFKVISEWIHYAILELLQFEDFISSPKWMANVLDVAEVQVECALKNLSTVGLIQVDTAGKISAVHTLLSSVNDIPSQAIREHHRQLLGKAEAALSSQAVTEREFQSLTLAFSNDDMPEAKKMIRDFILEFNNRFSKNSNNRSVFVLGTQFYRLSKKKELL